MFSILLESTVQYGMKFLYAVLAGEVSFYVGLYYGYRVGVLLSRRTSATSRHCNSAILKLRKHSFMRHNN